MNHKTYHIFFGNLSNPLRVKIISFLSHKDMCVKDLSKKIKVEQSKLSHALASLKRCNLVKVERKGKQMIYSLNRKTMVPLIKLVDKHAMFECGDNCKKCPICKAEELI